MTFPRHLGIKAAALLLMKEKCGRYIMIRVSKSSLFTKRSFVFVSMWSLMYHRFFRSRYFWINAWFVERLTWRAVSKFKNSLRKIPLSSR